MIGAVVPFRLELSVVSEKKRYLLPGIALAAGVIVTLAVAVLLDEGGLTYHAGYAGAVWMFLPFPLGILFLVAAWRDVLDRDGLRTAGRAGLLSFAEQAVLIALFSQVGLAAYVLTAEPAAFARFLLGVAAFMAGALIIATVALLFRLLFPAWLGYVLIPLVTLLGAVRGLVYIITGNLGGAPAAIGEAVSRLSPPVAPIAFLAKDLASASPLAAEQLVIPIVHLVVVIVLIVALALIPQRVARIGAIALAAILLYLGSGLSTHRVDRATLTAIDQAVVSTERDLWPGYRLDDMRFAVRDGGHELFFRYGGRIERRPQTFEPLAYTATVVDGEPTLHVLGFQPTRALYDPFASNDPQATVDSYVGMLAHEGFHSFQFGGMEGFVEPGDEEGAEPGEGEDAASETLSPSADGPALEAVLDADPAYRGLWDTEMNALFRFLAQGADLTEYTAARTARQEFERDSLGDDDHGVLQRHQETMELFEGTARYIEMRALPGDYRESPFFAALRDGVATVDRPYTSGMGRALALDRLTPGWKVDYDFEEPLRLPGEASPG